MSKTVAEYIVDLLQTTGLPVLYSLAGEGDSLLMHALHRCDAWRRTELQHEGAVPFAAAAASQLSSLPSICYIGQFPGALQAVAGLAEARAAALPLLVLAVVPPASGQECSGAALAAVVKHAVCVSTPGAVAGALSEALRYLTAGEGPALVMFTTDTLAAAAVGGVKSLPSWVQPGVRIPQDVELEHMAARIMSVKRVTFLCGSGCMGARQVLLELARQVQAPIVCTLGGQELMSIDNDMYVGMTGLLGWGAGAQAVLHADLLVIWGANFPYRDFLPQHGKVIQVDRNAAVLGKYCTISQGIAAEVAAVAQRLLPLVQQQRNDEFLMMMRHLYGREKARLYHPLRFPDEALPLRPEWVTRLVSDLAEPDALCAVDTGPPLLWTARFWQMLGHRRLVGCWHLGTPAGALPQAVGVKMAYPGRQVLAFCSAEGLAERLDELLTLIREQLAVKVLVFHRVLPSGVSLSGKVSGHLLPLSFAAVARRLGMPTVFIRHPRHAIPVIKRWLGARGPMLLEAAVDGQALPAPPDVVAVQKLAHYPVFRLYPACDGLERVRFLLFGNRRFFS